MYPQKPSETYDPTAPPVIGAPIYQAAPPPMYPMQSVRPQEWSSGLCDCGQDCKTCCLACFCPCIAFGRIAEIVDQGTTPCATSGAIYAILTCFTGCQWVYSCMYRSKLRTQYSLPESPCNDCLIHCCCEPCALSQEYRELQTRGFDMKIGFQANMARQAGIAMTAPPSIQGGMMK
ncbi:Protein PLANT CADMIUM RESISTANCE 2 [Rhynchospora pubera]|uniref:Protein PLANT CADMIUM RESISTANCE 2 n=1 Tax=Rhynchospora pubera TaxID=906938 RepID=A0AAV8CSC4_9POAL|nr:Protein PLANT CADMIUM RESISTANCE 2 [Rhynchospora pubera]